MTSSGICQTGKTSDPIHSDVDGVQIAVNRWHVLELIKDAEKADLLQAEIDTLSGMYIELYKKSALQDSVIQMQKSNLKVCQDGWQDCESIVSLQKKDMDDLKYRFRKRQKIYQAAIAALAAIIIIK